MGAVCWQVLQGLSKNKFMSISYSVIGVGKLGKSLTAALHRAGYPLISLWNHNTDKARKLIGQLHLNADYGRLPSRAEDVGDIIFICVPDRQIESLVNQLTSIELKGKIVVHTSGGHPASVLQPLAENGASVAAFHPLQTFSGLLSPEVFENVWISIQGDQEAVSGLELLAKNLGAHPVEVSEDDKIRLHIAAIFASNYLVTLMDLARRSVEAPELRQNLPHMFRALMDQTLTNIRMQGPEKALTGPLSRGDISTVSKHLKKLEANRDLSEMYRLLGKATLPLVERNGELDQELISQLTSLLDE